ncbi:MAG: Smr/MutS family protein [Desulfovibrio sp.]
MARKKIDSLEGLKELRLGKEEKKKPKHARALQKVRERLGLTDESESPPKAAARTQEELPPDEENLFFSAMRGVNPLEENAGRQIAPQPIPPEPPASSLDEDARSYLDQFVRGEVDFELEFTEEYLYGFVRGLDAKTFNQLKAGALSTEGHLDLHGMNAEQAYEAMLFFLKESYLQGRRCVLLVTGRGINSPGGQSVLRHSMQTWLTREPLKRVVLAFCTARAADGGAGALYVLLRKHKKSQGKVQWDRTQSLDEPF